MIMFYLGTSCLTCILFFGVLSRHSVHIIQGTYNYPYICFLDYLILLIWSLTILRTTTWESASSSKSYFLNFVVSQYILNQTELLIGHTTHSYCLWCAFCQVFCKKNALKVYCLLVYLHSTFFWGLRCLWVAGIHFNQLSIPLLDGINHFIPMCIVIKHE